MIRQESTQSFETEEGLDKLSIGMYQNLRIPFTYEWAYPYWNFGTDEFTSGRGGNNWFNDYTDAFNSAASNGSAENWDHMFAGIGSANTLLANVPLYYSENNPNYNTRLGEGYFMRGYNYFRLVIQFGGVPLLTEPV
ncbi:MAG: RagB/SusD family nutrient uptake outer membrane protein, partial [Fermentimonas sp.]|nr:RagB/SusD family nutrient uptake outer membrane protein [Fermentimonas sp.]